MRLYKNIRYLFYTIVFVFCSSSHLKAQYDTKKLISSGVQLIQTKNYNKAILKFNKAIYVKPYLFEPYFYRGYTKYILGDYQGADNDFTQALKINPYYSEAYRFRGVTRGLLKDYNSAFKDFSSGIKLDTFNVYLYLNRAALNIEIGNNKEALKDCNISVKIKPTLVDSYISRGTAYSLLENYKKALADFNKAIELKPNNDLAYLKRGLVYFQEKKYKKAIADYDIAAKINPNLSLIYFYRALAKSESLDYTGALNDYNKVLEIDPENALTYFNLAILKTHIGAIEDAIKDYNKILQLKPNHILSLYNRAGLYLDQKKYKFAINDYTNAINLFPEFPGAYMNRSAAKRIIGDIDGAIEDYNTGVGILQKYQNNQGQNLFNEYTDTSKYFKKMIELDTQFEYYNKNNPQIQDKFTDIDLLPIFKLSTKTDSINLKTLKYNYLISNMAELENYNSLFTFNNTFSLNHFSYTTNKNNKHIITNKAVSYLYKATINQDNQNYNTAKQYYDKAISEDTSLVAAWFNRATLEMEIDEFLASFNPVEEMLNLNTTNTNNLQKPDTENGPDLNLAEHDLNMVIKINPDFFIAYYNLANLNCLNGDFISAIEHYNQAIEQANDFAEAYFNRGLVKIYQQDIKEGCSDLSKAGELGIPDAYSVIKKFCKKK
ncbi:MAG: tetratricopeptide repeat protein [Chlorobi bacterium]|nr:tetratricopeptide repeat protein [Chlorobiota bacterium]